MRLINLAMIMVLFLLFALPAFALQEDSNKKIYIVADSTNYNYKTGDTVYEGHVKVDQGTTHITSDRLTTKLNPQHKIKEAIAYGQQNLAHYWTLPKIGEPEMHANAKIIKFYPNESNITLEQEVVVTQGENSFQGQLILYNRNDQTVLVPASNNGRAIMVYNPDSKK